MSKDETVPGFSLLGSWQEKAEVELLNSLCATALIIVNLVMWVARWAGVREWFWGMGIMMGGE